MTKQILVADIGGTNCRFASFDYSPVPILSKVASKWIPTASVSSFAELLELLNRSEFPLKSQAADIVVIAIAGPVEESVYSKPPYINWEVNLRDANKRFGIKRVSLINDFVAQAYACRSPVGDVARKVKDGVIDLHGTVGVLGAGTNLGKALLVPVPPALEGAHAGHGGSYLAVPSEGGHVNFSPESSAEFRFQQFLQEQLGDPYVTWNNVVSGKGIGFVHQFLTGQALEPKQVTATFTEDSETLRWCARFFGRVSRNFALETLATGGLYVAGGVAAKVPVIVTHEEFRNEFTRSPRHSRLLKKIPIFLLENEESGLWGAAFCGVQKLGAL